MVEDDVAGDPLARADRQQMRTVVPPAKRGEIFDRKGRVLAYSVDADTIAAVQTDLAGNPSSTGTSTLRVKTRTATPVL